MLVARVHLNDINRRSTNVPGPRGSKLLQIQVNDRDATGLNNRRDRKQTDRSNCPHGHFHLLCPSPCLGRQRFVCDCLASCEKRYSMNIYSFEGGGPLKFAERDEIKKSPSRETF